ncbi:TylF/MycF/NovP-related O-methyltransferase [Roseovarius autotrophicus]|uniref:TylF/MycF/NovP-related O-methyltransferase n=1 Tax=Roseovarius autotrophicus TaxID=2824121 RepID=UPI001B390E90|nr:TylF/MycF/NovP-related O-methyltransferase [Roseovarius autotrophicus]
MKSLKKFLSRFTGSRKKSLLGTLSYKESKNIGELIADLRAEGLTYVGPRKLESLAWAAVKVKERAVVGDFVEAGVALGGSAILLGKLKPETARLRLYDVFEQIPAPGPKDGADAHDRYAIISSGKSSGLGGGTYYGYIDNLEDVVRANLASYGITSALSRVEFRKGLFEETLHIDEPVALAHIDCDWYNSVKVCIARIFPRLSPGGMMVFDDYKSYSGCRRAVDEWLATEKSARIINKAKSVTVTKLF